MDIPALRSGLLAFLTSTPDLTQTEKTKLRNRAVSEYPSEWAAYLVATASTDTAATRGNFLVWMTVNRFWGNIYQEGSRRENLAALPAPETMG